MKGSEINARNCDHYEKLGGYTGNCELNHGITCQGLGKICFTNDHRDVYDIL